MLGSLEEEVVATTFSDLWESVAMYGINGFVPILFSNFLNDIYIYRSNQIQYIDVCVYIYISKTAIY